LLRNLTAKTIFNGRATIDKQLLKALDEQVFYKKGV
jgi:hypothetical protein